MSLPVFFCHRFKRSYHALRRISAAQRKLIELARKRDGIYFLALMNDFLITGSIACSFVRRETMGKGIGISERHGKEKGQPVG
jgi:hypothetical protein